MREFSQIEYCVTVLWLNGCTIADIHKRIGAASGKTKAAIRGLVNRALDKSRDTMSRDERTCRLQNLRAERRDDGLLEIADFIARPIKKAPRRKIKQEPAATLAMPSPEPERALSKREMRKRKLAEERRLEEKKRIEVEERARRELGFAPRGVTAIPLEYLSERGLLADPQERKSGKANVAAAGNSLRRYKAGEMMRNILVSAYSSGLKTQNYESIGGGGGGAGVVIHAVVAEALANVEKIRGLMRREEVETIDQMLRQDVFVWQIPSSLGEAMILEDVRRILDVISVFFEMMTPDDFKARWEFEPKEAKPVDTRSSRRRSRKARDAILAAQRKVG